MRGPRGVLSVSGAGAVAPKMASEPAAGAGAALAATSESASGRAETSDRTFIDEPANALAPREGYAIARMVQWRLIRTDVLIASWTTTTGSHVSTATRTPAVSARPAA